MIDLLISLGGIMAIYFFVIFLLKMWNEEDSGQNK